MSWEFVLQLIVLMAVAALLVVLIGTALGGSIDNEEKDL